VNRLEAALRKLVVDVARHGGSHALVGGLAVSARVEPRLTRDLDLAVAVSGDDEAERVVRALTSEGYAVVTVVEHETAHRLATVRVTLPDEPAHGVVGDLLFASSGIEPTIVSMADQLEVFPGCTVPVAQVGHLVALKLLSRDDRTRPQDAIDLRALRTVATDVDIGTARDAVRLIAERGFARGRALDTALADWLRTGP
jgi:predicted nucleotidyltransferase